MEGASYALRREKDDHYVEEWREGKAADFEPESKHLNLRPCDFEKPGGGPCFAKDVVQ